MDISKLRQLIKQHGMNQTELAQLLKRDKAVITNLFQGKRKLKVEEALVISKHFNVPVYDVLGERPIKRGDGLGEATLIPFQSEPRRMRQSGYVVEKRGKYYFKDDSIEANQKMYALEVRDDSLNLSGILPGDIIISELDLPCKSGDIVIIQHYSKEGAETLLRKYDAPALSAHSSRQGHKNFNEDKDDVRIVSPVVKLVRLL